MFGNQKSTVIDGKTYHINLLDARTGFRTSVELSKILLPLLGQQFDATRHDDVFHGAPKTFTEMAMVLVGQMDKLDIEDMVFNRLLNGLMVGGQEADLDVVLAGNFHILFELVAFSIKENFGSVFSGKGLFSRFQRVVTNFNSPT